MFLPKSIQSPGGVEVNRPVAYILGGGAYNNGALTVDEATFAGAKVTPDAYNTTNGKFKGDEFAGENIYARKDVTITPNATFDAKDVRVLDAESAIILTGTLTKQINVTISEKPNANTELRAEPQKRKIGYLVAKGNGTYQPTFDNARFLHYHTNYTDPAAFDDQASIGTWDYVLTPAHNVVLGQRAEGIYNPNNGNFDGNTDNLRQVYTVFAPSKGYPDQTLVETSQLVLTDKVPARTDGTKRFKFVAWKDVAGPHRGAENTVAGEVDFNLARFFGNGDPEVTTILSPNSFTAYA